MARYARGGYVSGKDYLVMGDESESSDHSEIARGGWLDVADEGRYLSNLRGMGHLRGVRVNEFGPAVTDREALELTLSSG